MSTEALVQTKQKSDNLTVKEEGLQGLLEIRKLTLFRKLVEFDGNRHKVHEKCGRQALWVVQKRNQNESQKNKQVIYFITETTKKSCPNIFSLSAKAEMWVGCLNREPNAAVGTTSKNSRTRMLP